MAALAIPLAAAGAASAFGASSFWIAAAWTGGSLLYNALNRETIYGPKLNDLHTHISSYGAFIPQVWGTMRVGGVVIWATDLEPHEQSSGGKGGGPEVVTTTYTCSFDTLICRPGASSNAPRLLRIWANGRLIYDARDGTAILGENLPLVFYDGNSAQTADPTEESIIGAGLVSAYRGVCRVVFTDLDLTEFGNAIPQLNFEISMHEGESELSRSATWTVITPTAQPLTDHRSVGYDAETGEITIAYWVTGGGTITIPNYETQAAVSVPWRVRVYDVAGTLISSPADVNRTFNTGNIFLCRNNATLSFHRETGGGTSRWFVNGVPTGSGPVDGDIGDTFYGGCDEEFVYDSVTENVFVLGTNINGAWLLRYPAPGGVPSQTGDAKLQISAVVTGRQNSLMLSRDGYVYVSGESMLRKYDTDLTLLQTWTSGAVPAKFPGLYSGLDELRRNEWWVCEDTIIVREENADTSQSFVLYQMAATLPWTEIARVNSATTQGDAPLWNLVDSGLVLTDDGVLSVCAIAPSTVLHGDIVADVCEECGLTDYDVSELVDLERGVMTTQVTTGRAFIESLMPVRFYDAADSDLALKFVKRGHPSAVTIPADDLAARGENEEIVSRLHQVRSNDEAIPSQLFFRYINYNADYQIGTQSWRRQTGISRITQEVNVAMVLDDREAKQIVDAWGWNLSNERDAFQWNTLRDYLKYEPTDVMTVEGIEMRATKRSERMAEGLLAWEGFKSRLGLYVQPGLAGEAEGFPPQEIPVVQETESLILDIPLIPDVNTQSVAYVAMQGALRRSWRGAALMKSIDGGANYDLLLTQTSPDSIGECVTALGSHGGPSFDEASVLRVRMGPGAAELATSTREAVCAGGNMVAIGSEGGGFELAHHIVADLIDEEDDGSRVYDVSRFLRGRRGTEAFKRGHAVGDKFVVLPTKTIMNVPRNEVGRLRHYKTPTIGSSIATATAIEFTSAGIPMAALAPINTAAGFDGDGDCLLQWDRRSRISFGWIPGVPQPLGEELERYRIRIFEDGTKQTVLRTEYSDSQSFEYTVAMQAEDFGYPLSVTPAWDVAQKCLTGWGWTSDGGRPTLVPSDFPGYIPPNPPPADTTYYVNSTMPFVSGSNVQALTLTPNQTWAIAVTVGATPTTLNDLVSLIAIEYTGAPIPRIWTFSPIKGDFAPQSTPYSYNLEGSPYPSVQFQVIANTNPGYPVVPSGATWYLNIRTLPTTYTSCPMQCNISNVP